MPTRLLSAAAAVLVTAACATDPDTIRMVTTTSVENAGLLEFVLPAFEREFSVNVEPIAVGSGQAFQIGRRGDASLLLTHEPIGERALFTGGLIRYYRKVMFNRFVIAGPPGDPAGIGQAASASDAMARIARGGALFVSRGDESGTHVREKSLWQAAGTRPVPARLIETGQGMAATLRVASQRSGYVLTDEATLARVEGAVTLRTHFANDAALINTYAVAILTTARPSRHTETLAQWLAEGQGQAQIDAFRISGRQVFFRWPAAADATRPESVPPSR